MRKPLSQPPRTDDTGRVSDRFGRSSVSVVIPVKDDAALLERCLEALWLQTERADEIVVVDNASRDLTREVARWWHAVYVYEPRPGIAAAASAGYDAADGEIIARLDADSVPPAEWVHCVREEFAADAGWSAVTGPGRFAALPAPLARAADVGYMRAYFGLFRMLLSRPPLFGSSFAMSRETWLSARSRTHRLDPHVHDDLDLSFALDDDARVALCESLQVQISARPFANPLAFARRVWLGVRTVGVNRRRLALTRSRRPHD